MTVLQSQSTRRWPNVGLVLAHRLRRWPNTNPTLGERLVFAGLKLIFISLFFKGLYSQQWKFGCIRYTIAYILYVEHGAHYCEVSRAIHTIPLTPHITWAVRHQDPDREGGRYGPLTSLSACLSSSLHTAHRFVRHQLQLSIFSQNFPTDPACKNAATPRG